MVAIRHALACSGAACLAACLAGCISLVDFLVPMSPADVGPHTDVYEVEMELVPDATLVRIEATPRWELGRHVFQPGKDQIVVLSRITSWADKDDNEPIPGTLRERRVERAWITIPGHEPIGAKLQLEDLEVRYLTGFDVNNLDGKGAFIGPHLMKGFITLKEMGTEGAVVELDVEIRPTRPFQAADWIISGAFEIPVYELGRRATMIHPDDVILTNRIQRARIVRESFFAEPKELFRDELPAGAGDAAGADSTPTDAAAVDPSATPLTPPPPLAGRWVSTIDGIGHEFDFAADHTFTYMTRPTDDAAADELSGSRSGKYLTRRVESSLWIVLFIDRYEVTGRDQLEVYAGRPQVIIRATWSDKGLVLEGAMSPDEPALSALFTRPPGAGP